MNEYPKYKYHKTKEPVIVKDIKEEKALGTGWAESPAFFESSEVIEESIDQDDVEAEKPSKKGKK